MAYQPHLRIVFRGTLPGGEVWSTTCALEALGLEGVGAQAAADDCRDAMSTFVGSAGSRTSSAITFTGVDAYQIGTDGRATDQWVSNMATPTVGNGSPSSPPQCTMVISLRTGLPGRARRGRMYIPTMAAVVGADALVSTATQGLFADAAGTLMNSINDAGVVDNPYRLVVASGVGSGALYPVQTIQVGRVIDTQRRRRNSLAEGYVSRAIS